MPEIRNISISSEGSNSFEIDTYKNKAIAIGLEGDSNSTDINLVLKGKLVQNQIYGEFDSIDSYDLTKHSSNKKIFFFDVAELNDVELTLENNTQTSTDLVLTYRRVDL